MRNRQPTWPPVKLYSQKLILSPVLSEPEKRAARTDTYVKEQLASEHRANELKNARLRALRLARRP
jgi:hypothetical protein